MNELSTKHRRALGQCDAEDVISMAGYHSYLTRMSGMTHSLMVKAKRREEYHIMK